MGVELGIQNHVKEMTNIKYDQLVSAKWGSEIGLANLDQPINRCNGVFSFEVSFQFNQLLSAKLGSEIGLANPYQSLQRGLLSDQTGQITLTSPGLCQG